MRYFYKPAQGVLGDTIPYYGGGRYHVFYLRDERDIDTYGIGSAWHHISTSDFASFADHGKALAKEPADRQDVTVATGCVYTDEDGQHHIFYTGINPYFRNEVQREQGVLHATSRDLDSWQKVDGQVWYADEAIYERHEWRDPFVYKHPQTGRYHMILASRTKDGTRTRRGCTGLMTSDDLVNWKIEQPFYAPGRYHGHECPDLFEMNGWYYLVFSEYTTHTVTRYVMSRSIDGPWTAPAHNQFDNRAFYAAKTASDGERRFIFGWNPSKWGNSDDGNWQWGGCLTVHEVVQDPDGTLVVRMPPEADSAFAEGELLALELDGSHAGWTRGDSGYLVDSTYSYSEALSQPLGETYLLEGDLVYTTDAGEAGLRVGVSQDGESGYFIRFNLADKALQFGKSGGYRDWHVDHMPELDRPLEINVGEPLRFKAIVDKTAVVVYANDCVALSARMYGKPFSSAGVFADGAAAQVRGLRYRPFGGAV